MFFKHNNNDGGARKLPRQVHEYMRHRFVMLPEYLDALRYFEYDDVINGNQTKFFLVFSPYRAKEQNVTIKTDLDLKQHPELLLFEVHIDNKGGIYVADRRPPLRQLKAK